MSNIKLHNFNSLPATALLYQSLQSLPQAIFLLDTNHTIYFYNRAFRVFCRWLKPGTKLEKLLDAQLPNALEELIDAYLDTSEHREIQVEIPQKGLRTLTIQITPLASQGRSISMITIEDTTSLERLKRVRKDFIANVSHELRTPITAVQGFVETLLDGAKDDPQECKRFLEIVSKQVSRLSTMFDDLLELSRLEDGQTEIMKAPLSLKQVVESAREVLRDKALKKQLSLQCFSEQDGFLVYGNESLLERAIENVLDNAIKFSPHGGLVSVTIGRESDKAFLTVSDQGQGISAEHKKRVFERFYRADSSRTRSSQTNTAGSGLGLALVKHILELHNGSISVESSPGQGAAFTIILPISEMLETTEKSAVNVIR